MPRLSFQEQAADQNISEFFEEIQDKLFPPIKQSKLMKLLKSVFQSPSQRRKKIRRGYSKFERFLKAISKTLDSQDESRLSDDLSPLNSKFQDSQIYNNRNGVVNSSQQNWIPTDPTTSRFLSPQYIPKINDQHLSVPNHLLPKSRHQLPSTNYDPSVAPSIDVMNRTLQPKGNSFLSPVGKVRVNRTIIGGKQDPFFSVKKKPKLRKRVSIKVGGPLTEKNLKKPEKNSISIRRKSKRKEFKIKVEKNELRSILHETMTASPKKKSKGRSSSRSPNQSSFLRGSAKITRKQRTNHRKRKNILFPLQIFSFYNYFVEVI